MSMTRKQLSYIQQAVWKLDTARNLVEQSLGGTDVGDKYAALFDVLMDELIADLAENSETVD